MLADNPNIAIPSGNLDPEIHLPFTAKLELVGFIAEELPRWRDHPCRPAEVAETKLTEYLCDYLNSVAYHSVTWSHVQFRTETSDESCSGRKIDLTVKPRAAVLIIKGRRHNQFDALFPIECKRLPTPKGKDRDEREYVTSELRTSGGIQRFKLGYHGAAHSFAAMIAFVQTKPFSFWLNQINSWIRGLAADRRTAWSEGDVLQLLTENVGTGVCACKSEHCRTGLDRCELRHLWVRMS